MHYRHSSLARDGRTGVVSANESQKDVSLKGRHHEEHCHLSLRESMI